MRWDKNDSSGRTVVQRMRDKGLTPVRMLLSAGAVVLLAFPFVFPFTGASGSPLALGLTPTPTVEPPQPSVAFISAASSGGESVSPVHLEVKLSAGFGSVVKVDYKVTGGTATGGADYTLADGMLTFAPGDQSENILLNVINDALDEADETVVVTLSNAHNATLGSVAAHTYTIQDNDDPPTVAFAKDSSTASEAVTTANLEVRLSAPSGLPVKVDYKITGGTATSGVDYTLTEATLTFAPGDVSEVIAVAVHDDALDEANETIVVGLSNPINATLGSPAAHTYTIRDNDPFDDDEMPRVAFISAGSSAGEAVSPANLEVRLSQHSGSTVTVAYAVTGGTATNGADYTLANGTLTFAPGDISENISVVVVDDALDESDETIVVSLSNPSNAVLGNQVTHTYTIRDNDPNGHDGTLTVAFASASSSAGESVSQVLLEVRLSAAAATAVKVDYAVAGGTASSADYNLPSGTLTFTPGEISKNISVGVVDDGLDETDETIVVSLSNPRNASLGSPAAHTYTIMDNDGSPVSGGNGGNGSVVIGNGSTVGVIIIGDNNTVGNVNVGGAGNPKQVKREVTTVVKKEIKYVTINKHGKDHEDDDDDDNKKGKWAKDVCGDAGWRTFDNPSFKNQGQCVSHFARMK